jgi:hypothetical protein
MALPPVTSSGFVFLIKKKKKKREGLMFSCSVMWLAFCLTGTTWL